MCLCTVIFCELQKFSYKFLKGTVSQDFLVLAFSSHSNSHTLLLLLGALERGKSKRKIWPSTFCKTDIPRGVEEEDGSRTWGGHENRFF